MLVRGGAYGKTASPRPYRFPVKFLRHLPGNFRPVRKLTARRSRTTERSESVSEEAEYILYHIFC
jgi:hypothetical protein